MGLHDCAQQILLTATRRGSDLSPQDATTSHRVLVLEKSPVQGREMMRKSKICPLEILRLQNLALT